MRVNRINQVAHRPLVRIIPGCQRIRRGTIDAGQSERAQPIGTLADGTIGFDLAGVRGPKALSCAGLLMGASTLMGQS